MRAAMFNGPDRPITIEDVPEPQPGPGELIVRVGRCGLCGSDIAMTAGGPAYLPLGRFGHEWAGEVVGAGRDVQNFRPGARVASLPVAPCGTCEGCKTGNPLFCETRGYLVGGFGEFMVIPEEAAVPLPDSLSFANAALVEPMSCGLHALNLAQMEKGARVLVIGAGAMALSVVYWARNLGAARIAVLSRSGHRSEVARLMGADAVLGLGQEDQSRIPEVLGGLPDIVAECVGKEGMLNLASTHVGPRGTVMSMGMWQHGDAVVPALMGHKEARILFPRGYTVDEFKATARAFASGTLDPQVMVSDTISLEALPGVIDELHAGTRKGLKILVDPEL